jgi:hypothetical protein
MCCQLYYCRSEEQLVTRCEKGCRVAMARGDKEHPETVEVKKKWIPLARAKELVSLAVLRLTGRPPIPKPLPVNPHNFSYSCTAL